MVQPPAIEYHKRALDVILATYTDHKADIAMASMKHELLSAALGFMAKSAENALPQSDLSPQEKEMAEQSISQFVLTREYMDMLWHILSSLDQVIRRAQQIVAEHAE